MTQSKRTRDVLFQQGRQLWCGCSRKHQARPRECIPKSPRIFRAIGMIVEQDNRVRSKKDTKVRNPLCSMTRPRVTRYKEMRRVGASLSPTTTMDYHNHLHRTLLSFAPNIPPLVERVRLLGLDEVEETRDVLRRRDPLHATIVELLEDHEGRTAHLLATEVLDARLTLFDGVDDHVIQRTTTGRGNRNIVFVGDGTEAPQTALGKSQL